MDRGSGQPVESLALQLVLLEFTRSIQPKLTRCLQCRTTVLRVTLLQVKLERQGDIYGEEILTDTGILIGCISATRGKPPIVLLLRANQAFSVSY